MKKLYESPKFELLKCILTEDVLSPSQEPTIPIIENPDPGSGDAPVIPDF